MRATLYSYATSLPGKVGGNAIGVAGVVASLEPDKVKSWIAGFMTPDQIRWWGVVAIAICLGYWVLLLLLKPKEAPGSFAPQQSGTLTTHGDGSHAIQARDVHIHESPAIPASPARESRQPRKCPQMPIWKAIKYVAVVISDTDDVAGYPKARREIRQAALNQRIVIWGRRQIPPQTLDAAIEGDEVWTTIEPAYWKINRINERASDEAQDDTDHTEEAPVEGAQDGHWSLRLEESEVCGEWPNAGHRAASSLIATCEKVVHRAADRDTSLHNALIYAATGSWDALDMAKYVEGTADKISTALAKFHQLASDGALRIWGIQSGLKTSDVYVPIPATHWGYAEVDYLDALREKPFSKSKVPGAIEYTDILLNRAEVEREWPHV